MTAIYPNQVCKSCGDKAQTDSRKVFLTATYHMGICDVCGDDKPVTDPATFSNPQFDIRIAQNG